MLLHYFESSELFVGIILISSKHWLNNQLKNYPAKYSISSVLLEKNQLTLIFVLNTVVIQYRQCLLQNLMHQTLSYKLRVNFTFISHRHSLFMWLVCQKKSYLICDEITNFWIFMKPIPKFFWITKLRLSIRAETAARRK